MANELTVGVPVDRALGSEAQFTAVETAAPVGGGFLAQSVGGVFDSAFDLYKRHFGTLALIVACVFIPTQVILHAAGNVWLRPLIAQTNGANPDPLSVFQVIVLGFLLGAPQYGIPGYLSLLTSFMASGPVAVAVANFLLGRPSSVAAAYRGAIPVFWRLFWTWNLFFFVFCVVFVGVFILLFLILLIFSMAILGSGLNSNTLGPEIGVAFLVIWIVVPYLVSCILGTILFAFAPPLIALENLTVFSSVTRNTHLVSRRLFWRICLALTFLPIVTFGLQMLILGSASSVVGALNWPAWSAFVINTSLSSLISFFFQPYWMIFITLLYFDCRVRKEGLDVRFSADNLAVQEVQPEPLEPTAPVSSPPADPRFATPWPIVPPLPPFPGASGTEHA